PPPDTIHQTAVLQTNFNNSKFAENFQNRSQQPLPPNTKNLLKNFRRASVLSFTTASNFKKAWVSDSLDTA
ncbi:hypothetical protein, partial [Neisseria iguanae]|uniref:hypothetical protein n=1 Tax=Neisseria iguanae TaxID=90242 RepID=UPI001B7FF121